MARMQGEAMRLRGLSTRFDFCYEVVLYSFYECCGFYCLMSAEFMFAVGA